MNNDVIKTGMSNMVDTESTLLADMYASHLVSQIENSGDRISLTFTAQGALAFAKALIAMADERKGQVVESKHEDCLIPKKDVMSRLGVTHATLWNWEKKHYLMTVKIGRKVFYHSGDVDNLSK